MQVSEEELKSMLAKAYECGWRGFLEGRDECVSQIASSFRSLATPEIYCSTTTTTVAPSAQANAFDSYYFYTSTIPASDHNGVRRDIV